MYRDLQGSGGNVHMFSYIMPGYLQKESITLYNY